MSDGPVAQGCWHSTASLETHTLQGTHWYRPHVAICSPRAGLLDEAATALTEAAELAPTDRERRALRRRAAAVQSTR